jgi:hypothetical protein
MRSKLFLLTMALLLGVSTSVWANKDNLKAAQSGVQILQLTNRLRIEINGELFTEYFFKDVPRPYFYPVIGPSGLRVTREWPLGEGKDEEHDHPHHRSIWFAHGSVNGQDFWSEQKAFGKIVHEKLVKIKSGKDFGIIKARSRWINAEGKTVCSDERTITIHNRPKSERMFDFEITMSAPKDSDLVLGDTKEGSMAVRVAETMRVIKSGGKAGDGRIVLSSGIVDDGASAAAAKTEKCDAQTWGKRAEWADYSGPVNGKVVGIAIFDHPKNPRHPTWWHVRDYGLFAANPFGIHDFEKKPSGTGDFKIPAGKNATFRYRFYIHEGDERQGKVAENYVEYSRKK